MTAPSIHPNGKPYERLTDRLSTVPEDVVALIHARQAQDAAKGDRAAEGGATLALADILAVLQNVRPYHQGFMASCPAHDDANPSLSLKEGPGGRVLAKCFAGCMFQAIMREVWARRRDRQLAGVVQ